MRRRLVLAGTAASVAAPAARAQRAGPPRIGIMMQSEALFDAGLLREAMAARGLVDGTGYTLDVRTAGGDMRRLDRIAADLVREKVDVLVALLTPAATAAKRATTTIPVVMLAGDVVENGLVASMARPGGNVTGVDLAGSEIGGKWLELLREAVPGARRIGVLVNPPDPFTRGLVERTRASAARIAVEIETFAGDDPATLEAAVDAVVARRMEAVVVQPSLPTTRIAALARARRLPTISDSRHFVAAGGLMSYGRNDGERYRQIAHYLERILKGASPATLPVMRPTQFDLFVNTATARAIGVALPQSFLQRADEVIE